MSDTTIGNNQSPRALVSMGDAQTMVLVSVAIACSYFLDNVIGVPGGATPERILWLGLVTLIGAGWKTSALPSSFTAIVFAINLCSVGYLIGTRETYDLGLGTRFLNSVSIPIALGLVAFTRPAFAIWPAMALHWSKADAAVKTSGWGGLQTGVDYIIVLDLVMLLLMLMTVYTVYFHIYRISGLRRFAPKVNRDDFFSLCVIILAAVHLSNYFYSGLGKLFLEKGNVLTWLLHNETYILSVHATDMRMITIQNILPAVGVDLDILPLIIALNTPINIAVLLGQLCSVICLLSLRKSAALTVFYDIMHVGIFLLTGIFFWKWIILNAAFIFSFNALRASRTVKLPIKVFGCLLVIAAPLFFHIATLAWFDTGAVNEAYFEATTVDGTNVRVPSNFFLDSSIDVAIQRFSSPYTGFLPTGTWGTTGDAEILDRVTSDCEAETSSWTLPHPDWVRVNTLIQSQQRRALVKADDNGHLNYDAYPHHIWSAPWLFPQFANLDIRTVKSYRLIVRSDCVYVDDAGTIQRKPAGRATYEFPLQTSSAS